MFGKLRVFSEISKLVKLANDLSDRAPGNTPKFGFLLTNRSFLVPAIGIIINILILLNFPLLAPVLDYITSLNSEVLADRIVWGITAVTFFWSFIERMGTKAKVVVTKKQAKNAVAEVVGDDKLAKALTRAIES